MDSINTNNVLEVLQNYDSKLKKQVRFLSVILFITIGLIIVHSFLFDRSWTQYVSKGLIIVLILFYTYLFQKQITKTDVSTNVNTYIINSINKLNFQKKLRIVLIPIYLILLFLLLTIYFYDFFYKIEDNYFYLFFLSTFIYFVLVSYFGIKKEKKKIKTIINPIIKNLNLLKKDL